MNAKDRLDDWLENEMFNLDEQLRLKQITPEQHKKLAREIKEEYSDDLLDMRIMKD
jgi:hypothetical protein